MPAGRPAPRGDTARFGLARLGPRWIRSGTSRVRGWEQTSRPGSSCPLPLLLFHVSPALGCACGGYGSV